MAVKNYYVANLLAPANPAASLAAGGTLTNGTTYYYVIQAIDTTSGSNINQISPASAEVSATCDASNKSISLTWDAVTGAAAYRVFRTTVSGDYNTDASHFLWAAASIYYTATTNSFTDDGSRPQIKIPVQELIRVRINGGDSDDPITPENIYTSLLGSGYTQAAIAHQDWAGGEGKGAMTYIIAALHIGITSAGANASCYFKIPNSSVCIVEGRLKVYSQGTITTGEKVTSANGDYGRYGGVLILKSLIYTGGNSHGFIGTTKIYDGVIKAGDYSVQNTYAYDDNCSIAGAASSSSEVFQSMLSGLGGNSYFDGDLSIERGILFAPHRVEYSANGTPAFSDVFGITNGFAFLMFNTATTAVTFNGLKLVSNGLLSRDFDFHRGSAVAGVGTLVDCSFAHEPPVGRIGSNPTYMTYLEKYTLNVNVRKPDGTALEGATVTLTNAQGDEDFSVATDSSGDITAQQVLSREYLGKAGSSGVQGGDGVAYDLTNHNDFTITISKAGYETITSIITILRPLYLDYTMEAKKSELNMSKYL